MKQLAHSSENRRFCRSLNFQFICVASMFVAACAAVGPNYKKPDVPLPSNYKFQSVKNGRKAATRERWWTVFNDSRLNSIMSQVRGSNQEIRAALARVQQARSNTGIARSAGRPNLSTSPSIKRSSTSGELNFTKFTNDAFSLPLDATWELDLFGRIRRSTEAAEADARVSEENLKDLRLSLEADAAVRYFTIRSLDQEISIVREEIAARENSLKLIEDRFNSGAVSKLDVSRAQAELAVNKADLASLSRQRSAQVAALALLAGRPASSFSVSPSPLLTSAPRIPSSIPSELLRSRPDIRAAERQVAAANARVGVATAAFYPSISLTGQLGVASTSLSKLANRKASFWSIGPEVYLPIFTGGKNKAALAFSQARYEEVLADYQQSILAALSDVETRLSATRELRRESSAQSQAVTAAREARKTAKEQYDGGISDFLSVLDAERTALDIERSKAQTLGAEYVNTVNLIRALGGRW